MTHLRAGWIWIDTGETRAEGGRESGKPCGQVQGGGGGREAREGLRRLSQMVKAAGGPDVGKLRIGAPKIGMDLDIDNVCSDAITPPLCVCVIIESVAEPQENVF